MQVNKKTFEEYIHEIADFLLVNGTLMENSGLLSGKMGVIVFFFYYAQYTENELFEDYAIEMFDSIQKEIHRDSLVDYSRGLAGIGVGVEFLQRGKYLDIDTDKVLEDFDLQIRNDIFYKQQENNSIYNGLCGLGLYLLYRINYKEKNEKDDEFILLTNREIMVHVVNIMENARSEDASDIPDILSFLGRLYQSNLCNPKINRCIHKLIKDFSFRDISFESQVKSIPAFLYLRLSGFRVEENIETMIDELLQKIEDDNNLFLEKNKVDNTGNLLWLLRCKKLIQESKIDLHLTERFDRLINKYLSCIDDWIKYEKNCLSIHGCAGIGLILMTLSGRCDNTWIELLG